MNNYIYTPANSFSKLSKIKSFLKLGGFISGGCFKNIFKNESIRDLDIFFENEQQYEKALETVKSNKRRYKFIYANDNCESFYDRVIKVRFELVKSQFGSPEEMMDRFDFSIIKFALFNNETYGEAYCVYHDKFFEHLMTNKLVIQSDIPNPVATLNRVFKYNTYGYGLCRESKVTLIREVMSRGEISSIYNNLYFGFD
jgi:hypothetical protein